MILFNVFIQYCCCLMRKTFKNDHLLFTAVKFALVTLNIVQCYFYLKRYH